MNNLIGRITSKKQNKIVSPPYTMPTVNKLHCLQCCHPFFCSIIRLPTTTIDRQPCLRECLFPYIITNSGIFLKCFSLNSTKLGDKKIYVIKRTRTCHLLCKRPACNHSTRKTHIRDRIFKLSPIHISGIY